MPSTRSQKQTVHKQTVGNVTTRSSRRNVADLNAVLKFPEVPKNKRHGRRKQPTNSQEEQPTKTQEKQPTNSQEDNSDSSMVNGELEIELPPQTAQEETNEEQPTNSQEEQPTKTQEEQPTNSQEDNSDSSMVNGEVELELPPPTAQEETNEEQPTNSQKEQPMKTQKEQPTNSPTNQTNEPEETLKELPKSGADESADEVDGSRPAEDEQAAQSLVMLAESITPTSVQVPRAKRTPTSDIVLGQIDAELTRTYVDTVRIFACDTERKVSHKYTNPPEDIFEFMNGLRPKDQALFKKVRNSYVTVFNSCVITDKTHRKYHEEDKTEFCVLACKDIPSNTIIEGLDGYFADAPENAPRFSIFARQIKPGSGNTKEQIMLGPASFINHSCEPNATYECGGPSRSETILRVKTLKKIELGREILVSYSDDYFGPENRDCLCTPCVDKKQPKNGADDLADQQQMPEVTTRSTTKQPVNRRLLPAIVSNIL